MPICTPAEPVATWRTGVGSGVVYGAGMTLTLPASSVTSIRPSGRNFIAVGRLRPVARMSFWK